MSYVSLVFTSGGSQLAKPNALDVAPTGMGASLVNGSTLHSAFQLNFGDELSNLADNSLDNLRNSLERLVLLVIDDMRIIRSDLFYQLHERLQQIKQNDSLFGGVAILLFGDLLHLKHVRADLSFKDHAH